MRCTGVALEAVVPQVITESRRPWIPSSRWVMRLLLCIPEGQQLLQGCKVACRHLGKMALGRVGSAAASPV